jgi:hypothetical protein
VPVGPGDLTMEAKVENIGFRDYEYRVGASWKLSVWKFLYVANWVIMNLIKFPVPSFCVCFDRHPQARPGVIEKYKMNPVRKDNA